MTIKDYIIAALLLLIIGLWIFGPKPETPPTKDNIKQAKIDSAAHAKELARLNGVISSLTNDLENIDIVYQKKLEAAKRLTMVEIDSIFVERYNVTLSQITPAGARLLTVDLLEGQRAIEQIKTYERIVSSQAQAIASLKGIIKSDSVQIVNLRIEAKQAKKLKTQNTLLKIGGVTLVVASLFIK